MKVGYCVETVYIWYSSQTTLDMVLRVKVGVESKFTNFSQQDQGFPTVRSRRDPKERKTVKNQVLFSKTSLAMVYFRVYLLQHQIQIQAGNAINK